MVSPPLRFGVIGAHRGGFAVDVAAAIPDKVRVVAVCDIRRERAERLAARAGDAFVTTEIDALLARSDVDAVVVATPDHDHALHAIRAFDAGKHVLSEIPMASTLAEIDALIAAADRADRRYLMGNEVRWLPALEKLKAMGDAGCWGTPFYGEAEYLHNLRTDGWRETEPDGVPHWRFDPARPQTTLLGGGPHAFDTLRWLSGERAFTEAYALGVGEYVPGHPEPATVVATLRGASGAVYKVTVSYAMRRPYCLYFSLYGDRGSFEGGRTDQEAMFFQTQADPERAEGWHRLDSPYWSHPGYPVSGHGTSERFMVEAFVDAVRGGRPTPIDTREAARSIAPAICALESLRTGMPVAVPEFGP